MCAADFNHYSNNYRSLLKESLGPLGGSADFFDPYKIACIKKWVTKSNQDLSILDFGCGEGRLTGLLAHEFITATVYGYDVAEKLLERAKYANQSLDNVHFEDSFPAYVRFDLILAANVFHHISVQDRGRVLLRLKGVLKSAGRIVIFEHNPLNPITRHIVKSCPFDEDSVLISSRALAALAESCGLKVIQRNYILYFPWSSTLLRNIEGFLRHVPLGGQYMMELANKAP